MDRIRVLALPVIANAWIAAIGQPSPMTSFALVVLAEIGNRLLRHTGFRAIMVALTRNTVFALAALLFRLAVDREGYWTDVAPMQAQEKARRPAFVLQRLRVVRQASNQFYV